MLKELFKYISGILVIYTGVVILIYFNSKIETAEILGFVLAGVLCTINVFITLFFIKKILKKPDIEFVKGYIRSTLIRLFFLLAIFFTIVMKMPVNHFVFSVAFFILYFLFQTVEIYILHTFKQSG
ncbi:MAG: hypothetical protein D8M58_14925 [Calditrichaeota bacterium]|nr:MAG: hypothetical protein DWQ03_16165 [Calditrichota bacterium]MBL1206696.1 hypothetical protein [Calditrichota bacterium]